MNKKLDFFKYHGTGNDFILINSLNSDINLSPEVIDKEVIINLLTV